jgi:hypothetical protein
MTRQPFSLQRRIGPPLPTWARFEPEETAAIAEAMEWDRQHRRRWRRLPVSGRRITLRYFAWSACSVGKRQR